MKKNKKAKFEIIREGNVLIDIFNNPTYKSKEKKKILKKLSKHYQIIA